MYNLLLAKGEVVLHLMSLLSMAWAGRFYEQILYSLQSSLKTIVLLLSIYWVTIGLNTNINNQLN